MSRLLRASGFALVVLLFVTFGPMAMRGAWSLVPVKGAQVGCSSGCDFESSFLTTNKSYDGSNTGAMTGWTADVLENSNTNVCANGTEGRFDTQQLGVGNSGGWVDASGNCDGVLAAANYASGAGGKGFRHWLGIGKNSVGGGISIAAATTGVTGMVNVGWMERASVNLEWNGGGFGPEPHYIKKIYMNGGGTFLICGHEGGGWGCNTGGGNNYGSGTCGWVSQNGGNVSDNAWHHHEFQINKTAGTLKMWQDGTLCLDRSSVTFGAWSFNGFFISNQEYVSTAGYMDYDDIKIEFGLAAGDRIGSPTEIGGGGGGGGTGGGVPAPATGLRLRVRVPGIGGLFTWPAH